MQCSGRLVEWDDVRGFGFVQPDDGGERLFVHISAFQPRPPAQQRPACGWQLHYRIGYVGGKACAQQVQWQLTVAPKAGHTHSARSQASTAKYSTRSAAQTYAVLLAFVLLLVGIALLWGMSGSVPVAYACWSLLALLLYWKDKTAAARGAWRTPEAHLHVVALLGGWPGALLAQQWLRHKSSKASFLTTFWLTVGLNVLGLLLWHWPVGQRWLQGL